MPTQREASEQQMIEYGRRMRQERDALREQIEPLYRLLFDISLQATRRSRAIGLKRYLETDLEIIERKAEEALRLLGDVMGPHGDGS